MARLKKQWSAEAAIALAAEIKKTLSVSHRQAKGLIDGRCVWVNEENIYKHGHRLIPGQVIRVDYDPERVYDLIPTRSKMDATPFETLFEDKHVLFVDKPAGLLTVPSDNSHDDSLADRISNHYRQRGFRRFELYIVHRLDKFTSGVLVFAKTPEGLHGLKKLFNLHKIQRIYKAILVGDLPENSGTLRDQLMEQAKTLRMKVVKGKTSPVGVKDAITHYRVIERLPGHTVLEIRLETGRRNQIRVQFADRGYPLLGDQVYGRESPLINRQALHAELLGFIHPITGKQITVQSRSPYDMNRALEVLRHRRRLHRAETGIQGDGGIYRPHITEDQKMKRINRMKKFNERAGRRSIKSSDPLPSRSGPKTKGSAIRADQNKRFPKSSSKAAAWKKKI
jgi:23S rRNA pseudouridine1911/1915/1917 synthase